MVKLTGFGIIGPRAQLESHTEVDVKILIYKYLPDVTGKHVIVNDIQIL